MRNRAGYRCSTFANRGSAIPDRDRVCGWSRHSALPKTLGEMDSSSYGVFDHHFWTVELRSRGAARFFPAGFLAFWLCGWLAGEIFALGALLSMLAGISLPGMIADRLPEVTASGGFELFSGLFLLFWLTFWTFGGYFAFRQLLTLLWGREEISVGADSLRIRSGIGPFLGEKTIECGKIQGIRMKRQTGPLTAEITDKLVILATLGTREERVALRDRLRETLGLRPPGEPIQDGAIQLLSPWETSVDMSGAPLLRRSRSLQIKSARIAWGIAMVAVLGFTLVSSRLIGSAGGDGPVALMFVTGGLLLLGVTGGVLHTWGRDEFVAHYRRLEVRRGVGPFLKPRVYPEPALAIQHRVDSDGDEFYSLTVREGKRERTLLSTMSGAREPVMIGRWLAREMGTELEIAPAVKEALAA